MSSFEFLLPVGRFDSTKKDDVLQIAGIIQSIIYRGERDLLAPEIREGDSRVYFPQSNDFWLHSPGSNSSQEKDHWRLDGRYCKESELKLFVDELERLV